MKDKSKILYERALITCVIMLFICVILKLFGANWFDFDTNLPLLKRLDATIMNSVILSFIYSFVLTTINGWLIIAISTCEFNKRVIFSGIISTFIAVSVQGLVNQPQLCLFVDFLSLYIATIFVNKHKTKDFIICCILNIVYQLVSLFIRNLGIQVANYGYIITTLFMLDYYIMLLITYIYLKKGGKTLCSIKVHIFSYLAKKLCRKHLEN